MTSSASEYPDLNYPPSPVTPALPVERLRPEVARDARLIPKYQDDVWPFGYMDLSPGAKRHAVIWSSYPAALRAEFKGIAWTMANHGLRIELVNKRSTHLVRHPSPSTMSLACFYWRVFAEWLQEDRPHIDRLADLARKDYVAWAAYVRDRYPKIGTRKAALVAITRLYGHAWCLAEEDQPPEPPWTSGRGLDRYAGKEPPRGENRTPPIDPAAIAALIAWASKIVDEYLAGVDARCGRDLKPGEMLVLSGAAIVLLAYLSGMRPTELRLLGRECLRQVETERDAIRYEIHGRTSKNQRDREGRHLTQGRRREEPWLTIEQGAKAIRVLQDLASRSGSTMLIAPGPQATAGAPEAGVETRRMNKRIDIFIRRVNTVLAPAQTELSAIPPDSKGAITLSRFRRTLAWHIVREPGGELALGVQYGHLRVVTGQGYAGRKESGMVDLIDMEELFLAFEAMERIPERATESSTISGPAAARLKASVQEMSARFPGGKMSEKQMKRLLAEPGFQIYDNPQAYCICMFKQENAACLTEGARATQVKTPALDNCQDNCANIARLDSHIAGLKRERESMATESAHAPQPLALRLAQAVARADEVIAKHHDAALSVPASRRGSIDAID